MQVVETLAEPFLILLFKQYGRQRFGRIGIRVAFSLSPVQILDLGIEGDAFGQQCVDVLLRELLLLFVVARAHYQECDKSRHDEQTDYGYQDGTLLTCPQFGLQHCGLAFQLRGAVLEIHTEQEVAAEFFSDAVVQSRGFGIYVNQFPVPGLGVGACQILQAPFQALAIVVRAKYFHGIFHHRDALRVIPFKHVCISYQ